MLFIWGHLWGNHIPATLDSDAQMSRWYVSRAEESCKNSSGQLNLPLSLPPLTPRHQGNKTESWEGKAREYGTVTVRLTPGTLVEAPCIVTFSTLIKHDPF